MGILSTLFGSTSRSRGHSLPIRRRSKSIKRRSSRKVHKRTSSKKRRLQKNVKYNFDK